MDALVVVESWFGNTREIAESIADGITERGGQARIVSVEDAPTEVPDDVDVLVLGAPTHNRGLSTPETRAKATEGRDQDGRRGVREWIESVELREGLRVAVFDTTTGRGWLSGSAAKAAARILIRREPRVPAETQSFTVTGFQGPLKAGETQAAHRWGQRLADNRPPSR